MRSNSLFLRVLVLCLCVTSSSSGPLRPSAQAHGYLRFAYIERHCQPALASAATLTRHAHRATSLKRELSFHKGDWRQDAGGRAPLVPFDGSDVSSDARCRPPLDPLNLATFMITHVDDERRARTAVNASGILVLSVSRKNRDPDIEQDEPAGLPEFKLTPGRTKLKITFEGVYTEIGYGERVLCMIGSALLPTRSTGGGVDPWEWATNSGRRSFLPPVTADDNILLVLGYPKELTLTTRAVLGEMRSTSDKSAATYFDPVQLVSQLHDTPYQFRSQAALVAEACASLPSSDAGDFLGRRARHLYNGVNLCNAMERYSYGRGRVLTALPNWHGCNSTATPGASCRSMGPFEMDRAADANEPAGVGIIIQDLRCNAHSTSGTVRVSAVFRAVPPSEDPYTAARRSGLGGTTLSAEGVWNASAGQGCMVACRCTGNETCRFRVCFYMPTTFSITYRSILVGRITSVDAPAGGAAHSTSLSFQLGLALPQYWGWDRERPAFRYNYTKVSQAGELLRRSDTPFSLRKIITNLLALSYPKTDRMTSLGHLVDYLDLHFTTAPGIFTPEWVESPVLHLKIIFLEQISDRHASRPNGFSTPSGFAGEGRSSETVELPINVSAELTVFGDPWVATSVMSLEGVYSPQDGRMYLIGCRHVGGGLPWRNSSTSGEGLENGMDCSFEVKVEYPPTTTHRFMSPTAKVRIASTRNAGDPLRFSTMKLEAISIRYPQPRPDDPNRGIANAVLGLILLSASIAASLSQLRHLKTHADAAPYVSLVMLVEQAIGLGLTLTTGVEALLARGTLLHSNTAVPSSFPGPSYSLIDNRMCQSIDLCARILSLAAFIVARQLFQEVRRSRARSPPREPRRVPDDAEVLAFFAAAHLLLAMLVLALNGRNMTVEQHVGLTQDLFLLPQVIGNAVWRVNCRPLAGSYYLGVTAARLLPRLYDYVRPPPVVRVYDMRVFSHAGDAVIPAVSVLLALVVHVQQRWNYAIVNRMGLAEQRKGQHIF